MCCTSHYSTSRRSFYSVRDKYFPEKIRARERKSLVLTASSLCLIRKFMKMQHANGPILPMLLNTHQYRMGRHVHALRRFKIIKWEAKGYCISNFQAYWPGSDSCCAEPPPETAHSKQISSTAFLLRFLHYLFAGSCLTSSFCICSLSLVSWFHSI